MKDKKHDNLLNDYFSIKLKKGFDEPLVVLEVHLVNALLVKKIVQTKKVELNKTQRKCKYN